MKSAQDRAMRCMFYVGYYHEPSVENLKSLKDKLEKEFESAMNEAQSEAYLKGIESNENKSNS